MSESTVKHETIVVERNFKYAPKRVFAAWADPNAQGLWKVLGDDWDLAEFENDFRAGGREKELLTDQSAFFDGRETPSERKSGWGQILDRLQAQMGREDQQKERP